MQKDIVYTIQKEKLPPKWGITTIDNLVGKNGVFVDGDWVESKDQDPNGEVRLIQLADIGDGVYRNRSERFLTYDKAVKLGCTFLAKGDVLVARMPDPLGRACTFPGDSKKSVTVVDVAVIRPSNGDFDTKWLMYFINAPAFRSAVALMESGSTRKRISRRNLSKIALPVPPFPQQKQIVSEIEKQFSRLDEAVGALKRIKANLKRYKASVLKAAVEGKLTEEWRKQNPNVEPAEKLLKRIIAERKKKWEEANPKKKYKEPSAPDTSNLPELPKGWAWATVGSLADNVHYGYTASSANDTAGPKLLRITDIQNNTVKWDAVPYCKIQPQEKQKYLLKDGDLVFARTGATVGKSFLIRGNIPEAVFASYLIRIILSKHTDKRFIYNFFQSLAYWMQIHKGKIGIGQPNVNAQTLSQIILPLPPLIEQQKIVEEIESRLSVAEEIEEAIDINLKRAERLRQAILKKAFSGKLRNQ